MSANDCKGDDEIVNNVNKTAILAIKEMMTKDPKMGAKFPYHVQAVWREGVVHQVSGNLVCHPPPEMQLGKTPCYPSMYSFCPVVSTACLSLILMMSAAENDFHFKSMKSHTKTVGDYQCFFRSDAGLPNPWEEGLTVEFTMDAPDQTEKELIDLTHYAENHCPSSEVMRHEFPVETDPFKVIHMDRTKAMDTPIYYNMAKYNEIANKHGPYNILQEAYMDWHCKNENTTSPDSLMTFRFPQEENCEITLCHEAPIGSGKYSTPVDACFFGGLSAYMHTVAARIYDQGYKIEEIRGDMRVEMNRRKVMAVNTESYIFRDGGYISLEIVTNAPDDVVEEIEWEACIMSPSHMNWKQMIPVEMSVVNVAGK